jgi:hypothetical protein
VTRDEVLLERMALHLRFCLVCQTAQSFDGRLCPTGQRLWDAAALPALKDIPYPLPAEYAGSFPP